MTIVGYTDNTGSYETNMRLSQQRADAVRNYLISQGVSSARLQAIGKGWNDPIATNATAAGRAQNRRVEMYITANEKMIMDAQRAY
jgi:Outer membrane protein and related peptidoglycan-associated (lipo)proteins